MHRGTLYVYAPGLLGPVPEQARSLIRPRDAHRALATVLARGHARPAITGTGGAEQGLCALWGLPTADGDPPLGRLAALGSGETHAKAGTVFRAAPVQLVPDRDRVLLLGPERLQLGQEEANACIGALNHAFAGDGLRFQALTPQDWFLSVDHSPRLITTPLDRIVGRPMEQGLPRGEDSRRWIARLNEMQMLLFGLPLNQDRQAQGLPAVNGVWIWGGGALPRPGPAPWPRGFGDDPLLRGLGRFYGAEIRPAVDVAALGERPEGVLHLPALPAVADGEGFLNWERTLADVCERWISPLLERLRAGKFKELVVDAGGGRAWHYRRLHGWRVWRRPGPMSRHVLTERA
ncbi:MAG: hypothetical protein JJT90_01900 [Ectothiorhodospiraceae bacterium]|nr:hypothetical protein [Ectothiorhodospiraceae bacterium]